MAKDKDGRPILTASDWKTGEDRKKESPAVTIWGAIWRALLPLGLIAIVGLIYRIQTQEEGESRSFTEGVQIFGPILGIIGLPLFGLLVYAIYFDGQCPNCKRRKAIEKTDATRSTGGFWSDTDEEKYKCKYCGVGIWVKVDRDTGGGGCGG
ncbi:MAG: hypothetical protein QF406_15035 [Verrucomicrobiota bacterium]|nr:hypothetical protein [Verrucomicrobiota bacterium]